MKEKKEEKKGLNSVKVSQDVLRLATTIAILAVAKAEDEDQEGSNEFWFFQAVFATVVVLLTVFFQWLWKVGVRLVNESAARSHPGAGGEKEKEEKGKEGRSGGELGLDQRGPVRLPQGPASSAVRPNFLPPENQKNPALNRAKKVPKMKWEIRSSMRWSGLHRRRTKSEKG